MQKEGLRVAIVGATGAVGREILSILEERNFPVQSLKLLASSRSEGTEIYFKNKLHFVETACAEAFEGMDLALFSAGSSTSLSLAPEAWKRNCVVVDNSSAWRMDPLVPLVVPEVNEKAIEGFSKKGIIGNPNCSTIQMVVALKIIHDLSPLKRVIVSTYQAASGAGQKGIEELQKLVVNQLNLRASSPSVFAHNLAFNLIPHIDIFREDGFTREESKMILETRKIMDLPGLPINATCVRVPVFNGHSESIYVETEKEISLEVLREAYQAAQGITLEDQPMENSYPMPMHCSGKDDVFVGRLRKDTSIAEGLSLWVVADNLRKGAALNAVQIAEVLAYQYLNVENKNPTQTSFQF